MKSQAIATTSIKTMAILRLGLSSLVDTNPQDACAPVNFQITFYHN
jgi:hypothetical protein